MAQRSLQTHALVPSSSIDFYLVKLPNAIPAALLYMLLAAAGVSLMAAGCGNESIVITDDDGQTDIPPDSTLPDGFVDVNRPPNPSTTFQMPCPLGEVEDSFDNPYLITNGFPEGIPAIDVPEFIAIARADPTFDAIERVIAVEYGGVVRGFPVRILLHHELVNLCWEDSSGQQYSFVTYCPLVDGALHFVHDYPCFEPARKFNESFGVSGFLFNGNLVMYARHSGDPQGGIPPDLYSQLYGGGITGTCAEIEPVIFDMTWAMFKKLFPKGKVLSENTGFLPDGGYDAFQHPYTQYWQNNDIFFPVAHEDPVLGRKVPVYGVVTPTGAKAYSIMGKMYVQNDDIGGTKVVVWNDPAFGCTAAFEPVIDGQYLTFSFIGRERNSLPLFEDSETGSLWTFDGIAVQGPLKGHRLAHLTALHVFWFAWTAFYPGTELYIP